MSDVQRADLDDPAWHDFVTSRSESTPFHHPSWARLLADCYGFGAFALVLNGAGGEIVAGAPVLEVGRLRRRIWKSLPFTDALAILGETSAVSEFVERSDAYRSHAGIPLLSFRTTLPYGVVAQVGVTHELALEGDVESLWRGFDKSRVRSEIRRAEREGVVVRVAEDATGMQVFYDLHLETRRRQGVPVQPRRFFELLQARMVERGLGYVAIAEVDGRPAAAAVLLTWNRKVIFKLAASDRDMLRFKPNHALLWQAIRSSAAQGYDSFDFGRSDLANDGLRAFKRGWGAVEKPLGYTSIGASGVGASGAETGVGAGQRIMERVIRRSPAFVCRLLGEALYRYAA